jgi:hypothetical protein
MPDSPTGGACDLTLAQRRKRLEAFTCILRPRPLWLFSVEKSLLAFSSHDHIAPAMHFEGHGVTFLRWAGRICGQVYDLFCYYMSVGMGHVALLVMATYDVARSRYDSIYEITVLDVNFCIVCVSSQDRTARTIFSCKRNAQTSQIELIQNLTSLQRNFAHIKRSIEAWKRSHIASIILEVEVLYQRSC